jgi:putative transcriptional regulator
MRLTVHRLKAIPEEIEMTKRILLETDSAGEILGLKLLQSVCEMKSGQAARVTMVELNEVAQARQSTGISQVQFAEVLCISKRTLQEWEHGRRAPSGAAQTLIRIIKRHPEVLLESIN